MKNLPPQIFFFDDGTPFTYNSSKDALLLEPEEDNILDHLLFDEEENEKIRLFARSIITYNEGTIIRKHCAPWGDNSFLTGKEFLILMKIFRHGGDIVLVIVQDVNDNDRKFAVEPPFFDGWTDDVVLKCYDDFVMKRSK